MSASNETVRPLSASAQRVQAALEAAGFAHCRVSELTTSTRTAAEAAAAVGCALGQIAKSLIFRAGTSGRAVLVIASGANRVDEKTVSRLVGEPIARADAEFVRNVSGYAIGGVPPLGHTLSPTTIIDRTLLDYNQIWAAAGTPNALFPLTPEDLVAMTGGRVAAVSKTV